MQNFVRKLMFLRLLYTGLAIFLVLGCAAARRSEAGRHTNRTLREKNLPAEAGR